ncbi:MAG TPA: ABC transporter permease [Candidatus Limnocylindria bacterium]|nr:ABC transporter permease [Candidatus Limnocylindria bacterium]
MVGYIVRRVLWMVPVLFFVSLITFALMRATPGGPFDSIGDGRVAPQAVTDALNARYGLNDPPHIQYVRWLANLVQGDLGPSYKYRDRTVNDIVGQGLATTVQLGVMAFLLAVGVGIPLGVVAALRHNGIPDYAATLVSVIGVATPSFVLSILLLVFFSVTLRWFPTHGWDSPAHWVLPTVALAGFPIAQIARYTRASMLEVTRRDYVRTAHSKGLREGAVVSVHMVRNALIPVVTVLGPLLAFLVTGSFIIETIFSVPGIGRLFVTSIAQRDYGVIMASTMIFAVAIVVMNLVVDVLYAYIDPRIRYS